MKKRIFDVLAALCALLVLWPVLLAAAVGVLLTSRGPVLYRATRTGRDGKPFTMYKFRTMRWQPADTGAAITAAHDSRIFPFGAFLRKTKIDELPQLINVLLGDISVVGPRPEDPKIVAAHYAPWMMETLSVRPGITSPGALWGYTKMDAFLAGEDPEQAYVDKVLAYKLALELVYVRKRTLMYDLQLILRTVLVILQICLGKREFDDPPEAAEIDQGLLHRTKDSAAIAV